jgi:glucokinase
VTEELTEPCNCGNVGCLEQVATATGIVRLAKMQLEKDPDTPSVLRGRTLSAKQVWDAVKAAQAEGLTEIYGYYYPTIITGMIAIRMVTAVVKGIVLGIVSGPLLKALSRVTGNGR